MTARITPATVRALLDRATKGPWIYEYTRIGHTVRQPGAMSAIAVCNTEEGRANCELFAASKPLAAAYLEALAVIEGLIGSLDTMSESYVSEYAGRMYEYCSGCEADLSEGHAHKADCIWTQTSAARAFLAKHKEQSEYDRKLATMKKDVPNGI